VRADHSLAPARRGPVYASLTIAITTPAMTQTTIATCIQIHVGDTGEA
jgi:hypothetical protein